MQVGCDNLCERMRGNTFCRRYFFNYFFDGQLRHVGFHEQGIVGGGDDGFCIEPFAERKQKSVFDESFGSMPVAAKSVPNPRNRRILAFFCCEDFVERLYGMDDKRLVQAGCYFGLHCEYFHLFFDRCSFELVDACFSDSRYLRMRGSFVQKAQRGGGNIFAVPWMDAYAIILSFFGGKCFRRYACNCVAAVDVVAMGVENHGVKAQGRSRFLPPDGSGKFF